VEEVGSLTHRGSGYRRAHAERDAIRQVCERLSRQFPELPPDEIEKAVYGKYDSFAESPVRDFVPVLVERGSRQRLTALRRGSARA
jgi:hypothetical protein